VCVSFRVCVSLSQCGWLFLTQCVCVSLSDVYVSKCMCVSLILRQRQLSSACSSKDDTLTLLRN